MIIQNSKVIKSRTRTAKLIGYIVSKLPYVRSVILTGSLARDNANQNSDIDIMIIARTGRIFSARFFVNTFGTIFGIKRAKDETKNHAGKFCFNYFVADNYLTLPTGRGEKIDRFCAEDYSGSKFIAGDRALHQQFLAKNRKLFEKYGFKTSDVLSDVISTAAEESSNKRSLDDARDDKSTTRFERWAKKYQIKRIESDPITKKYPNLIVYNDNELRFHPPKN